MDSRKVFDEAKRVRKRIQQQLREMSRANVETILPLSEN